MNRIIEEREKYIPQELYRYRRIDNKNTTPKYIIGKRNANVDAAIEYVPDLAEVLLSYHDIRNQKDENVKKLILKAIADYLEPIRKRFTGTSYAILCDDLFIIFNKCSIRHNNKDQWKLNKKERMSIYDDTFKAAIHLFQMDQVKEYKDRISELKKRFENS